MDGIAATIWASQTTSSTLPRGNLESDVGTGRCDVTEDSGQTL